MCNINVLIRKKSETDHLRPLLYATAQSFAHNSDAEGVFFSGTQKLVKDLNKIDLLEHQKDYDKSHFVICHERIATSGHSFENTHPFESKRFVLIHNGVFFKSDNKNEKSDTALFFAKFIELFDQLKDIKLSIEKAIEESNGGWYSVFLYDKFGKKGFYFKNSSSRITCVRLENDDFYLTTDETNLVFFDVKKQIKIDDRILYCFQIKNGFPKCFSLGKLHIKDSIVSSYYSNKKNRYSKFDSIISTDDEVENSFFAEDGQVYSFSKKGDEWITDAKDDFKDDFKNDFGVERD